MMKASELFRLITTSVFTYGFFTLNTLSEENKSIKQELTSIKSDYALLIGEVNKLNRLLSEHIINNQTSIEKVTDVATNSNSTSYIGYIVGGLSLIATMYYPFTLCMSIYNTYKAFEQFSVNTPSFFPSVNTDNTEPQTSFHPSEIPKFESPDLKRLLTNGSPTQTDEQANQLIDDLLKLF